MTISTPVFIGIFLLCCTGCAQRACGRLAVEQGSVASVCLAAALLSGFTFQPFGMLYIHPASLLLLAVSLIRLGRFPGCGLLTAFTAGALGWLMQTLFPAFSEPCLFTAVPAALLSALFLRDGGERLASTLLAPLLTGGLITLSDWYLFDDAVIALGSGMQLDAQACGGLLLLAFLSAPQKKSAVERGFHQNEA